MRQRGGPVQSGVIATQSWATPEVAALPIAAIGLDPTKAILVLTLPGALVPGALLIWLRRRRKQRELIEAALVRRLSRPPLSPDVQPTPPPASPRRVRSEERLGTIIVNRPSGERERVALTRRPLTLGRSAACDIVIDDPDLRSEHVRIRAISPREVQIHALGERGADSFEPRGHDLWLIAGSGEQIAFGSHSLEVMMGSQQLNYDHGDKGRMAQEAF